MELDAPLSKGGRLVKPTKAFEIHCPLGSKLGTDEEDRKYLFEHLLQDWASMCAQWLADSSKADDDRLRALPWARGYSTVAKVEKVCKRARLDGSLDVQNLNGTAISLDILGKRPPSFV